MAGPRRSGPKPDATAGKRRPWRPSLVYLAIAVAILAVGVSVLSFPSPARDPAVVPVVPSASPHVETAVAAATSRGAASSAASAAPARATVAPPARAEVSRVRDPNGDLTPDISDFVNKGEKPSMAEVIDRLHQAGVTSGLGAFSPPGTRPPLIGIAVPEDYPLPPGYVRHYQATDDGQRIEPILMFAPDHQLFDAEHRPIAMPKDRVVPPELAPPGLPIRRIVIPAPSEPGR
jgi:hypothetical protein